MLLTLGVVDNLSEALHSTSLILISDLDGDGDFDNDLLDDFDFDFDLLTSFGELDLFSASF